MRITQKLSYDAYVNDIFKRQEAIYRLNKQLATQKKVNAPSDDPVNAHNILTSKSLLSRFGQYERNIGTGLAHLGVAEQALDRAKDVVMRLQELAVTASSGTANSESMGMLKKEVDNLFDELVSIGNTSFDGRYVFSGYKTDTVAFDASGVYQGDANVQSIKVSPTSTVVIGVNGGEAFSGSGGGTDLMAAVSALSSALGSNDAAGVLAARDGLDAGFSQLSNAVSDIGGKVSRLKAANSDISVYTLELESTISTLEDADIVELITSLKSDEVALQASLSSAGKVFSLNIFDYI